MGSMLSTDNPAIVAAFHAALAKQGLIILAIVMALAALWIVWRSQQVQPELGRLRELRAVKAVDGWRGEPDRRRARTAVPARTAAEPAARRLLRIGFGILWVFDGLLQAQPAMPVGLADRVTVPAAGSSPGWVQHLSNWAGLVWDSHPVGAAAATVWIQLGLGLWLLAARTGPLSRLAGAASAGWALAVWAFGEAFGAIFAPGLTVLFGAPGAVLFYAAAGAAVALPERYWDGRRMGRVILAVMGLFFAGMAVLQAWPGRGYWQGRGGTLTGMVQQMFQVSQPGWLSGWLTSFASFVSAHGFAVNLAVVIVLAASGLAFLSMRERAVRFAVVVAGVFCLADWVLVEDLGFMGGTGTDPNSMIPITLLLAAGYLGLTRPGVPAAESARPAASTAPAASAGPALFPRAAATAGAWRGIRGTGAVAAIAVVLTGTIPMAVASARPSADTIIATALDGPPASVNYPAPGFALTDQHGREVTLASMRGRTVLLTFLDPVCTTDCTLIAQEFRDAGTLLGDWSRQVEMVAIVANPLYRSPAVVQAFDRQERLDQVPNWLYLTGTTAQLEHTWKAYGFPVQLLSGGGGAAERSSGGMIGHNDIAYVIDPHGRTRLEIETDPGPGSAATMSSFSAELAQAARQVSGS
ncbi:MAG TPA: SCO family protein [Streptosporangiaceae bacterium]|nr:SCO family protein [Streptosporangiaceae bacterium]